MVLFYPEAYLTNGRSKEKVKAREGKTQFAILFSFSHGP